MFLAIAELTISLSLRTTSIFHFRTIFINLRYLPPRHFAANSIRYPRFSHRCLWHVGLSLVDLIDVVQRKRLPRTEELRRGEMKSVLCIIVHSFLFIQGILN